MGLQTISANDSNTYDALIIGGGPAALTAAIYLRRANFKVGFIEKEVPGGKIVNVSTIDNFPGFESISGADLALKMYEQATKIGAEYIFGEVTSINKTDRFHVVYTHDGVTRLCKALIVAVGTTNKGIGAKNEAKFFNKGVSFCAVCDGTLAKDREVAVIGGGESALSNSLYLSNLCSKIYLIHRNSDFKNVTDSLERIKETKKIELIPDSNVIEFLGKDKLESIKIKNTKDNSEKEINISYAFIYAGSIPSTSFLEKEGILNSDATIKVNEKMETSVEGIYAIGDVIRNTNRQITTATADGTVAALSIAKYLREKWR